MYCSQLYDSINNQYRNYHTNHQNQEELCLIKKFTESPEYFHSYIRSKKVWDR